MMSHLQSQLHQSHFDFMLEGTFLAMFVASIFGVFVGFGLLRLKNWARISALVWAPIGALFSLLLVVSLLFIPMPVPLHKYHSETLSQVVAVALSGLPLVIGVWFLVLFNRKGVVLEFWGTDSTADRAIL